MKIYFDDSTFIWKYKLNLTSDKDLILKEALDTVSMRLDKKVVDAYPYIKNDDINFDGNLEINSKLDIICQYGIDTCKSIYKEEFNLEFNKISTDAWINIIRSINPVQPEFKYDELNKVDRYHIHTEIQEKLKSFVPTYTYVYYIQMPDVMESEDGVLYFKGENDKEYWIKPEEDDLIVMPGSMPHAPNNAPKSTIDRVVLAGNVGIEFSKKEKTLF
jgi:hypothetical protein